MYVHHRFLPAEQRGEFWQELRLALASAIVTTRFGLAWGEWMRRIPDDDAHTHVDSAPICSGGAAPLAHVGSPDVFYEGRRRPLSAAGDDPAAEGDSGRGQGRDRSLPDVRELASRRCASWPHAQYPPIPDLTRSKDDPQFYSGSLWLMATGSWKVRVPADGRRRGRRSRCRCPVSTRTLACRSRWARCWFAWADTGVGLVAWWPPARARATRARRSAGRARRGGGVLDDGGRAVTGGRSMVSAITGGTPRQHYARYMYKPLDMKARCRTVKAGAASRGSGLARRRGWTTCPRSQSPDAPLCHRSARDGTGMAPASRTLGERNVPPRSCRPCRQGSTRYTRISCTPTGSGRRS